MVYKTNKEKERDIKRLTAERKIDRLKERYNRPGHSETKELLKKAIESEEKIADKNRK
jgi:uncharacterized protein with WD repeat